MSREIRIHRTYFHPDDIYEGDIPRDDVRTEVHDEEWMIDHADNLGDWNDDCSKWIPASIAQSAADLIAETGCAGRYAYTENPSFVPGGWYELPDGETVADEWDANYTGRRMEVSCHLSGFTEDEEAEIYRLVTQE